jgi:hypothetical protein
MAAFGVELYVEEGGRKPVRLYVPVLNGVLRGNSSGEVRMPINEERAKNGGRDEEWRKR